jgi:hypothetical protein
MYINHSYSLLTWVLILSLGGFSYAQNQKPTNYGIFLDNSPSLRSQFDQVQKLGSGIVYYTHHFGPVSLFNFKSQGENKTLVPTSGVEWSRDESLLNNYINSLSIEMGDSPLLDAIDAIAEKINAKTSLDKNSITDKLIILVTDGEDRKSHIKEKQLIKKLQDSKIKVYAIGLLGELEEQRGESLTSPKEKAESRLKNVTKETGGRVVLLKSNTFDIGKVITELFTDTNR